MLTKGIVNAIHPKFTLDDKKCIGCGSCARNCPEGAIALVDKKPVFRGNCSRCLRPLAEPEEGAMSHRADDSRPEC